MTTKAECLNDSGRWENHMYNFDNLPHVIYDIFKTINVEIQFSFLSLSVNFYLSVGTHRRFNSKYKQLINLYIKLPHYFSVFM